MLLLLTEFLIKQITDHVLQRFTSWQSQSVNSNLKTVNGYRVHLSHNQIKKFLSCKENSIGCNIRFDPTETKLKNVND